MYNIISAIALIFYLPFLFLKKGPEDKNNFLRERLGISHYTKTDIWVHAVSVGEVIACVPFLKRLKKEFPGQRIVLSTTTYTGQKVARERFPEADRTMYMPFDTGLSVSRVVNSLKPEIFITIETELWPALFRTLKKSGSKIIILNGRISSKSFKGYKRLGFLMKNLLSYVDFFYMQGKTDAERIMAIGADKYKVDVMGNFKFDISFNVSNSLRWLENIKGRTLLAASTHKGEEEIILDAYERTIKIYPDLKLIIAPRHPERFNEVDDILKKRNLNFIRRTMISDSLNAGAYCNTPVHTPCNIILLDTIGELSMVFSKATIAFIGGSLVPLGGHNILEPAYWAKPIIFGPYMDNFAIAGEFLLRSAALQVKDADDIAISVKDLLDNHEKAAKMGQNAKTIIEENAGAVKKAIELVRGFIGTV